MLSLEKIENVLQSYPTFRRSQVFDALFKNLYEDWNQASNIPRDLRLALEDAAPIEIKGKLFLADDNKTAKALIYLEDGEAIETVLMSLNGRNSVCVSTQVGCAMGCAFCDSGRLGFSRNLTVDEIVAQVIFFSRYLKKQNDRVTNIIFMGIGEPFLNYENVITAVRTLSAQNTLGLSARRFSISTSGIIPGIEKLAKENLPVNLAISLHSASDKIRSQLMPVNKRYSLEELSDAINSYYEKTKRKVMYEYLPLSGVNTSKKDAQALREFVDKTKAAYVVNLIPMNRTACDYNPPSSSEIKSFKEFLTDNKINFVQRYSFGKGINAACGQLVKKSFVLPKKKGQ